MSKHEHWCKQCGKKVLKWGVVLYALHFLIHGLLFLISPVLGMTSFGLF